MSRLALTNSLKSALVPWLARIPERVGYAAEGRSPLLTRRVAAPPGRPPMVAFYGALAGASFDAKRRPRLRLERALLEETAIRHGLQRGGYWTFAPGAENTSVPASSTCVVRALAGGTLERTYTDGKKEKVSYKTGEVRINEVSPAFTTKNVGKNEIKLYVVQVK